MTEYPLIELIDKEIHALDDWRAKKSLLRRRKFWRGFWYTLWILAALWWVFTLFVWISDFQLTSTAIGFFAFVGLATDHERFSIPELEKAEKKAKAVYETRVQCTLGAASGY